MSRPTDCWVGLEVQNMSNVTAHRLLSGTGGTKHVQCHGPQIAEWDWRYKTCPVSRPTDCWVGLEVQNMSNVTAHWLLTLPHGFLTGKVPAYITWGMWLEAAGHHTPVMALVGALFHSVLLIITHKTWTLNTKWNRQNSLQQRSLILRGLFTLKFNLFCLLDKISFEKASPIKKFEAILVVFNPFTDVPAQTLCARQQNLKSFSLQHAEGLASKQ